CSENSPARPRSPSSIATTITGTSLACCSCPSAGRAPGRSCGPGHGNCARGIGCHQSAVDHVDVAGRRVHLANGASLPYEVLVVATGAALLPGEPDGRAEAMARGKAFTFYEPAGPGEFARR